MDTPSYEDVLKNPRGFLPQTLKKYYNEFFIYLNNTYPNISNFLEKLYLYFQHLSEPPVCKVCGKNVKFENFKKGYHTYCCSKCAHSDVEVLNKTRRTNIKMYGAVAPICNKNIKNKIFETIKEKYGGIGAQSSDIKEKMKLTNFKRYGVEYVGASSEIQEKIKQTHFERYAGMGNGSDIIKEKTQNTNLERYGCVSPFGSKQIQEKIKQTNLERYGVDNVRKNNIIKEKVKQTNLEKYNSEYPFGSKQIQIKLKHTNIERYGTEFPLQNIQIKEKAKQTNLNKYGTDNYSKTKEFLIKEYDTKKKNNSFNSSKIEQNFKRWLIDNNIEFDYQHHDDVYPFDCDFYFPKTNSYLEIQGSWVHGSHPYDLINDEKELKLWEEKSKTSKFYKTAIKIWTEKDVKKRQWAKEHNLQWHEVFTTNLDTLINECFKLNIF